MSTTIWVIEWPRTEGWFWFYGYEFGKSEDSKPKLVPIEVRGPMGCGSFMYSASSHFLYEHQAVGIWTPMVVPTLPKDRKQHSPTTTKGERT